MKNKILNTSLIVLFFVVFVMSCKKTAQPEVSLIPEIESVNPIYARNEEEVSVQFKGVGINNTSKINIKINKVELAAQYSGYHNVVKFKIPKSFFSSTTLVSSLEVEINGKTSKKVDNAIYSNFFPKLDRFIPNIARIGDEVTIYGYNFMPDTNKTSVSFFGNNNTSLKGKVTYIDPEVIKVIVPANAETNTIAVITGTNDVNYSVVPLLFTENIRILKY
ncbi:IPT/TIG domain-containing protein [Pedobacter gandavensis]|uniref:IPT/TIG domain-containing protein n=1 Tax=Pedobacter gandavensis TaxID=2679963 RepID=UPI00292E8835|nr:IPT/TIG domain-containing protein [Pedobacter gandavensis]